VLPQETYSVALKHETLQTLGSRDLLMGVHVDLHIIQKRFVQKPRDARLRGQT